MLKLTSQRPGLPEILQSEDIASSLRVTLYFVLGFSVYGLIGALQSPGQAWGSVVLNSFLLVIASGSALVFLQLKKMTLAVYVALISNAVVLVYAAWSGAGVNGVSYAGLILPVLAAGLFLGPRAGYFSALIAMLLGGFLLIAGRMDMLVNVDRPVTPVVAWLANTLFFFVAAHQIAVSLRQVERALHTAHDEIDERVSTEAEIRRLNTELEQIVAERTTQLGLSEQRYRLIAENANDMIWTMDMNLHLTYASPSLQRALGYSGADLDHLTPELALTPASLQTALEYFREEVTHAHPIPDADYARTFEMEFRRKDGTTFWAESKFAFLRDAASQLIGVLGVGRDVTGRKQAEDALKKSEEKYRDLYEDNPLMLFTLAMDGTITAVNATTVAQLEYAREELIGQSVFMVFHPEDRAQVETALQTFIAQPIQITPWEFRKVTKSGRIMWVSETSRLIQDKQGEQALLVVCEDITEHKRAEEALRASEQRFRVLVEQLPAITYTDDVTQFGKTNYISPQIKTFLGITPEAWVSGELDYWVEHIHPDDRARAVQEFEECFYKGLPVDSEYRLRAQDGRELWFHDRSVRVDDASGQPQFILGVMTNISERKRAEKKLEQQAAQLTVLHQLGQAIVASLDLEQVYTSAHHAVEQLFPTEAFYISLVERDHSVVHFDYLFDKGQRFPAESLPLETPNLTAHVLKTGAPLFIADDTQGQSHMIGFDLFGSLEDTRSVMIVPLKFSGEVIGTISAQHYQSNIYTEEHLTLLTMLANQVAIAIQNARLVQSLRLQTAALEAAANAIVITDRDNIIQWANPAFTRLTGYTAEEAIGHNPSLLRSGRHDQAFYQRMWKTLNAGEVWHGEIINRRKDGSLYTEEQIITPVRDAQGQIFRYIAIKQDISERKRAEENLTHERNLLQALLDNIPDTIYFKDRDSRFTRINQAQARVLGVASPEAAIGKTDLDFQDSELARQFFAEEQNLMATGLPLIDRVEFNPLPDGTPRWLTATKVPLRDAKGAIVGLVGLSRDITAHKLAEEREHRRRAMLEKVVELGKAVTQITDLEPCLREIHQSVQKGLGFDRVGLFMYDPVQQQVRGAFGTDATGQIEDTSWFTQPVRAYDAWEKAISDPHGISVIDNYRAFHEVHLNVEMEAVQQHVTLAAWVGEQPIALIAADNVLSQKRFSSEQLEALQLFAGYAGLAIKNAQWNDNLEQRVRQRTTELETANREIESLSYTIAHDMRSPVRAMVGYSQMLVETHKDQLDETGKTDLEHIHHEAKRMGQLVDDFLAFLRIARRPLQKQILDMSALTARVWEQARQQRAGRKITVHIGSMPPAQADADLLEQVWMQFISNAIKFTRPRAQAEIEIGVIPRPAPDGRGDESAGPVYFIRDNGIGFDMRFADKLFSIFQRLNRQEDFEGTGIGLAIAQRIIHKHGGRIWAESEVDKGATFYFTLP